MLRRRSSDAVAAEEAPRPVGPGGRALLASEVRLFERETLGKSAWLLWKQHCDRGIPLPLLLPDDIPPAVLEHRSPGLCVAVRVHFYLGLDADSYGLSRKLCPCFPYHRFVVHVAPDSSREGSDPRLGLLVEGDIRITQDPPHPKTTLGCLLGQILGPTFVEPRRCSGRLLDARLNSTYRLADQVAVRLRLWGAPFQLRLAAATAAAVGDAHDVVLVADGAREFPAHRGVLAAASPVLAALLRTDCRETRLGRIEMHCSAAALELFLQCAYAGCAPLADHDWGQQQGVEVELLRLADMLLMDALKLECESRLLRLPADRAVWLLHQAVRAPQVPDAAVRRAAAQVADGWSRVRRSSEWASLVAEQPAALELVREQAVRGHRQRQHRGPAPPSNC